MKKTLVLLALLAGIHASPAAAQPEKRQYYRLDQGRPVFTESSTRPVGAGWTAVRPRTVTLGAEALRVTTRRRVGGPSDANAPGPADPTGPIVAVVDTGIDESHPWFTGRLLPGTVFHTDGAGIADLNGHGTHVAGIVARENPQARILPIRALDRYGAGDDYNLAQAVTWAVDSGASVINMSLGAPWELGAAYLAALQYAEARNVVVVAANGNEGPNAAAQYPAAYPEVVAVTAVDSNKVEAEFAQRGHHIDIAAPGVGILSSVPGGTAYMSGTSMATPKVTGTLSILRTLHPDWTAADLRDHVASTAEDVGRPGRDNIFGAGVLDKQRAITLDGPLRSAATAVSKYLVKKVPGGVRINALPWRPHRIVVEAQRTDGVTRTLTARTGWRLLYDEPGEYRVHAYDKEGHLLGWETVLLPERGGAPAVEVKPSRKPGRIAVRSGNTKTRTIVLWAVEDKRFSRPITEVTTGRRWVAVRIPKDVDYIACYYGINNQLFGCHKPMYRQPLPMDPWPVSAAGR